MPAVEGLKPRPDKENPGPMPLPEKSSYTFQHVPSRSAVHFIKIMFFGLRSYAFQHVPSRSAVDFVKSVVFALRSYTFQHVPSRSALLF